MGASLTVYCLDKLTDYLEFERLCHDIMSLEGYESIEPLGGFSDKGRDAIHVDRSDQTTIFAYSVREDWRVKLAEDARKIHKYGHKCDRLVFVTTADFTASERDEAVGFVGDEFGWELDLYGIERLRVLLDAQYPHVKLEHPQIFPSQILALQSKADTSIVQDHLFISYAPEDSIFATWLTQRLTAEGYRVWCEQFKLLGGETYPDDIDEAIRKNTFRVVALYSNASLAKPEIMRQRALALSIAAERQNDFLIPLQLDGISLDQLDRVTSSLKFISFEENWARGLKQLLAKLESIDCPKPVYDGKSIAAEVFLERDVVSEEPELLFSNCLEIVEIPKAIHRLKSERGITLEESRQLQFKWAHRRVNSETVLCFHEPSSLVRDKYQFTFSGGASCAETKQIEGSWIRNLVSELVRKSLVVKCHDKGLLYCPVTNLHYFPYNIVEGNRLKYAKPDGTRTYVNAAGQRKYWQPSRSEYYRYHLAPVFWVSQKLFEDFVVLVRVRIRLTDTKGILLSGRKVQSRRKDLCRDWWNNDWLNRILAICQYLADDDKIIIGRREHKRIVINAMPFHLEVPMGIDEDRLDLLSAQDVRLWAAQIDEEQDENDEDDVRNDIEADDD